MEQGLFFAGVLGFDGPAAVTNRGHGRLGAGRRRPTRCRSWSTRARTRATATSRRASARDVPCYLWYDNDLFNNSAFGFLNLCTATRSVLSRDGTSAGPTTARTSGPACARTGSRATGRGGPNEIELPGPDLRLSGERCLAARTGRRSRSRSGNRRHVSASGQRRPDLPRQRLHARRWTRTGRDRLQHDAGAGQVQHRRVHRAAARGRADSAAEWGGSSLSLAAGLDLTCHHGPGRSRSRASVPRAQCPTSTPSRGRELHAQRTDPSSADTGRYDDLNKSVTWTGPATRPDGHRLRLVARRRMRSAPEQLERRLPQGHDGRGSVRWTGASVREMRRLRPSGCPALRPGDRELPGRTN